MVGAAAGAVVHKRDIRCAPSRKLEVVVVLQAEFAFVVLKLLDNYVSSEN